MVLTVNVDDADNLFDWLAASSDVYYDLEREVLLFGVRSEAEPIRRGGARRVRVVAGWSRGVNTATTSSAISTPCCINALSHRAAPRCPARSSWPSSRRLVEQLSRPVDEDRLGGVGLGVFVGSFDELAGLEAGAGPDERDEVRGVDRTPAVLGGLDELERHGQSRGA